MLNKTHWLIAETVWLPGQLHCQQHPTTLVEFSDATACPLKNINIPQGFS
jgi:hypothetical protein